MEVYKHTPSGKHLRLVVKIDTGINTYLEVDENNNPIEKQRPWSSKESTQEYIINGFKNLIKL